MIRQQQAQIQTLTNAQHSGTAVDDSTPTSERSMSLSHPQQNQTPSATARPRSPYVTQGLSRNSSYRSSRNGSPSIRPASGYNLPHGDGNDLVLGASASSRDESAFYQAETQMLTRENQMLKMRIRELGGFAYLPSYLVANSLPIERQLNPSSPVTHSPATASNLIREPISSLNSETSAGDNTPPPHNLDAQRD